MKNKKKIWIISFICAGAGILIMVLGITMGGQPGLYFDSNGVHASGEAVKESYVEDKKELGKFTSVDIDLDYADLEIIPSDKYAVEYRLGGAKKPVCTVEGEKLVFREEHKGPYVNFGFTIPVVTGYSADVYVRLYVPEKIEFDTIKINEEDGDIKLPALKAKSLEIINEYGDVKMDMFDGDRFNVEIQDGLLSSEKISADAAQIENSYGDVKISEFEGTELTVTLQDGKMSAEKITSDRIKADNEYGDIDIRVIKGKTLEAVLSDGIFTAGNLEVEKARIENEYGDVNLGLAGDAKEYSMDLTTEYGGIAIPGYEEFNGDDGARRKVENVSGKEITVICQDGDINLTTAK